mgnify:FL=1
MSEIKVNKISPRSDCGTTTLGDSGDSITVAGDLKSNSLKATDGGSIISQTGTTITIGASGDTIALASGASQSGFGSAGQIVDWQTGSVKTATFTAASGEGYFCNTTSDSFTVNLPAGSAGAIVAVQDYNNTFDSNALTVTPNGSEKINGGAGSLLLVKQGEGLTLVYIDSTVGWRTVNNNDFGFSGNNFISATGGTETTVCTNFKVHTFTSPGTFTVTNAGNPLGSNKISYTVVAGGGGAGGASNGGTGGGGAGGFREGKDAPTDSYSASPLATTGLAVPATSYPITVGAGGSGGGPSSVGSSGSDSILSSITSAGGGGGGVFPNGNGSAGGSGGGGGSQGGGGSSGNSPPVSPPQGNNGGNGGPSDSPQGGGAGGGGGATANGSNSPAPTVGGAGGAGATSSINGTPTARAGGGGGGGADGGGSAGSGGGGSGGGNNGSGRSSGSTNTGGGAGGGERSGAPNGGSGIVIIRYKFQ